MKGDVDKTMTKLWQKLIGQQFDDDNICPLVIALLCAAATTIIYLWDPAYISGLGYVIAERFLYNYFGHVIRIMEMAIYLKIVSAILKKGIRFNMLLGQTVLPMSILSVAKILAYSAAYNWGMPLWPYRIVIWFGALMASAYCFFLLRKAHGFSKVSAIITSVIYVFVCAEGVIPAVSMLILALIKLFANHNFWDL